MKEKMYVIATRGRNNKEIYLAYDEKSPIDKAYLKWTENIEEAMAMFSLSEIEDYAIKYFKNYNRWYIKESMFDFE